MRRIRVILLALLIGGAACAACAEEAPENWKELLEEKDRIILELETELETLRESGDPAQTDSDIVPVKTQAAAEPTPEPTPAPTLPDGFEDMLSGSRGDAVAVMQERLTMLGFPAGVADGIFGNGTKAAVEAFQNEAQLPVTGVVDGETYLRLFAADAPRAPSLADDQYAALTYKAIMTDPQAQTGKRMCFSGRIVQVLEQDGYAAYRIATKGNYSNIVYAAIEMPDNFRHYLVEERVRVFAICAGVQTYETLIGGTATIPSFIIDRMRIEEEGK